jgi:hypothetical protein
MSLVGLQPSFNLQSSSYRISTTAAADAIELINDHDYHHHHHHHHHPCV